MKSFKLFLMEMSYQEALSALGLSAGFSADDLKAAYKKAAIVNHPDRGGSEEMMKKVNAANDMLKKRAGSGSSLQNDIFNDMKARTAKVEKWRERFGPIIIQQLMNDFDKDAYIKFFENASGRKFFAEVTPELPISPRTWAHSWSFSVNAKIHDQNNDTVLNLMFSVESIEAMTAQEKQLGGGADEVSYPMSLYMTAYHNGRNQKFKQRYWEANKKHSILSNPSELLPAAKVKKMFATGTTGGQKNRKLKAADFRRHWLDKVGGTVSKDAFYLGTSFGKDRTHTLQMSRITLFRKAGYNFKWANKEYITPSYTFYETPILLDLMTELGDAWKKNKKYDAWPAKVNKIIEKYKGIQEKWMKENPNG